MDNAPGINTTCQVINRLQRKKRGDKVFRLLEVGGNDSSSDSDDELSENFEAILALKDDEKGKGSRKKNKFPLTKQMPAPLRKKRACQRFFILLCNF